MRCNLSLVPSLNQFTRAQGTIKQRAFIRALFDVTNPRTFGNGTQSARKARYKGSDNVLAGVAWDNLRKPQVIIMAEQFVNKVLSTEQIENELVEVAQSRVTITESSKMKALDLLTKIKGMVTQRVETVDVTERDAATTLLAKSIAAIARREGISEDSAAVSYFAEVSGDADMPASLRALESWPERFRGVIAASQQAQVAEPAEVGGEM